MLNKSSIKNIAARFNQGTEGLTDSLSVTMQLNWTDC